MPLLNLKTNLKSLKYGQDQPGGGSSRQPYITTDINTVDRPFNRLRLTKFDDGLVRGGIVGALNASVVDTLRIGKFFLDAPKGPLFIVKQIGLQLSNPRLEVPKNPANIAMGVPSNILSVTTNGLLQPTRVYNLGINTLLQVPINAFGGHIIRHGLLPIQSDASKYEAIVTANNDNFSLNDPSKNNRLISLSRKFELGDRVANRTTGQAANILNQVTSAVSALTGVSIPQLNKPIDTVIDDYLGGPGSVYGIGKTLIKRYSNTEDGFKINLANQFSNQFAGKTRDDKGNPSGVNYKNDLGKGSKSISSYFETVDVPTAVDQNVVKYNINPAIKRYNELISQIKTQNDNTSIYTHAEYEQNKLTGRISSLDSGLTYYTNTSDTHYSVKTDYNENGFVKSTLKEIVDKTKQSQVYKSGSQNNIIDQPKNTLLEDGSGKNNITALPSQFKYNSSAKTLYNRTNDTNINDDTLALVFTPINPFSLAETPKRFRAYLDDYSETYDSNWGDIKYTGRAESFYIFNSFKRTAAIGLFIPCFNKNELIKYHDDLFALGKGGLAYALAGQYSDKNLLGGIITKVTVGNYLVQTPGIITSLNVSIPKESPWSLKYKYAHVLKLTFAFTIIGSSVPMYEGVTVTPTTPPPTPSPSPTPKDDDDRSVDDVVPMELKIPERDHTYVKKPPVYNFTTGKYNLGQ